VPRLDDDTAAIVLGREVGRRAAPFAALHDREATFVSEGYAAARESGYSLAAVPEALGGGGHGLRTICHAQAEIARSCASTALAIAMHQHAVLTMAWRWDRGDAEVEPILRRVVDDGLMIAFAGPFRLSGKSLVAEQRDGGYVVRGVRKLCSASPGADVMVCLAQLMTSSGPRPLRLFVPLRADGVEIVDDWYAMGMRGSGTNSVRLDGVFVPSANVQHGSYPPGADGADPDRPAAGTDRQVPSRSAEHPDGLAPARSPALHFSLPVLAATYLGAATFACEEALRLVATTARANSEASPRLAGLMVHEATLGWWVLETMLRDAVDDSLGTPEQAINTLLGKRQVVLGSIRTVELAMELLGSMSYRTGEIFERTLRDVRAGITHPLTPEETLIAVGRASLESRAPELSDE
jgi:alkylation response protein AidB-like acyl-CoA dehydrogenase